MLVLYNENYSAYEQMRRGYIRTLKPRNQIEYHFLDQLAATFWRQQRAWYMETAARDLSMVRIEPDIDCEFGDQPVDDPLRIYCAWDTECSRSPTFANIQTYEARLQRQYVRILDKYFKFRQLPIEPDDNFLARLEAELASPMLSSVDVLVQSSRSKPWSKPGLTAGFGSCATPKTPAGASPETARDRRAGPEESRAGAPGAGRPNGRRAYGPSRNCR